MPLLRPRRKIPAEAEKRKLFSMGRVFGGQINLIKAHAQQTNDKTLQRKAITLEKQFYAEHQKLVKGKAVNTQTMSQANISARLLVAIFVKKQCNKIYPKNTPKSASRIIPQREKGKLF